MLNCRAGAPPAPVATEAVALQIFFRPGVDPIECFLDVLDRAPATTEAVALQIFLPPGVDPIECFLDVLDRVRYTEAKISLAEVAKGGAGQCSDTCVLEERVGQLFRWPSGLRDIWKHIERAMWDATGNL